MLREAEPTVDASGATQRRDARVVLLVVCMVQFAILFMFAGVGISLPTMGAELGASAAQLGLIETAYLGASAALLLPAGGLADLVDRRALFRLGLAIFVLATSLIGWLSSVDMIIVLRLAQGVGSALIGATGMAILMEAVDLEWRGRAIGLSTGSVYAGLAVGPYLAGLLTTFLGWRSVYLTSAVLLALVWLLTKLRLPGRLRWPSEPIDIISSGLISAAVLSIVFGGGGLNQGLLAWLMISLGLVLAWLFWQRQWRLDKPLLNLREVAANTALSAALLIQISVYSGAFGATFLYGLFLQIVQGYSPLQAGQILVLGPVLMVLIAPLSGGLADRHGASLLALIGSVFIFLGVSLSVLIAQNTSLAYLLMVIALQGVGFAIFSTPNVSIIMSSVASAQLGMASALTAMMRSVGMVFSMVVVTAALAFVFADHSIETNPSSYLWVMRGAFIAFVILNGWAMWLAWRRWRGILSRTNTALVANRESHGR